MRERYSQRVVILRRVSGDTGGGYQKSVYEQIAETSAQVRDESPEEYIQAESSTIGHVRTFAMRDRDVREDDVLVWREQEHRVRRIDRLYNRGREILVRASIPASRYSIPGA